MSRSLGPVLSYLTTVSTKGVAPPHLGGLQVVQDEKPGLVRPFLFAGLFRKAVLHTMTGVAQQDDGIAQPLSRRGGLSGFVLQLHVHRLAGEAVELWHPIRAFVAGWNS